LADPDYTAEVNATVPRGIRAHVRVRRTARELLISLFMDCLWIGAGGMFGKGVQHAIAGLNDPGTYG
jgi:hypothetical protein